MSAKVGSEARPSRAAKFPLTTGRTRNTTARSSPRGRFSQAKASNLQNQRKRSSRRSRNIRRSKGRYVLTRLGAPNLLRRRSSVTILCAPEAELNRGPKPELGIAVVAIHHDAGVEAIFNSLLFCDITEARLNNVANFPGVARIDDGGEVLRIRDNNLLAGCALEALLANINFPSFDLLKEANGGDIQIVGGSHIPSIQDVTIGAQPRPAEVLARDELGFNGRRTIARSEDEVLVVGARHDSACAKRQGGNPW